MANISADKYTSTNPYDAILQECDDDASRIQQRYEGHRQRRNADQRERLLALDFHGVEIDPFLHKLVSKSTYPNYVDPRHCLVFWARPSEHIKALVQRVQLKLILVAPNLWLMPPSNLHMTVLELTHSRTEQEITSRLAQIRPHVAQITDYTYTHRAVLVKPMLSFDASAMALSFVPATTPASTTTTTPADHIPSPTDPVRSLDDTVPSPADDVHTRANSMPSPASSPSYTYHHLRRDIYDLCSAAGAEVDSRYVLPSAHLTVARFVSGEDTATATTTTTTNEDAKSSEASTSEVPALSTATKQETPLSESTIPRAISSPQPPTPNPSHPPVSDPAKMRALVDAIDGINAWLQDEYWPEGKSQAGEWAVGHEKGLDCQRGTLWFGDGERVRLGRGF